MKKFNTQPAFIACSATGPRQWITLYSDGRVRLHAADLSPSQSAPFRTLVYRPKRRSDRDAIRRVVEHLNMMGAGREGDPCEACWCFESPNATGSATGGEGSR